MYSAQELAVAIKKRAKETNKIIKDMLVSCSLNNNTMSGLYHGKAIAFDSLAKIADYLGCSVDYLLGRTNNLNVQETANTHDDSTQNPQSNVLLDIFDELDSTNQAKLLVYAGELKKQSAENK